MATKLNKICGPFKTCHAPHFELGRARDIEITLYPQYAEVRALGTKARYHVPYTSILLAGAEMEVRRRVKRGAKL